MTEVTIDSLPARLTHHEAPEVTRQLAASLRSADATSVADEALGRWSIDASQLKQFDSSALAVLLECRRMGDAKGLKVQVINAPAKLDQLARLYGLDDLLMLQGGAAATVGEPV